MASANVGAVLLDAAAVDDGPNHKVSLVPRVLTLVERKVWCPNIENLIA